MGCVEGLGMGCVEGEGMACVVGVGMGMEDSNLVTSNLPASQQRCVTELLCALMMLPHIPEVMRFHTCKQRCSSTHANSDAFSHMQAAMRFHTCH
eukprot:357410-Chlamydomonas_euryale.AAC.1